MHPCTLLMATTPVAGNETTSPLDNTMDAAIASLTEMMEKQIKFTTESNPLKAADSIAKGSRL